MRLSAYPVLALGLCVIVFVYGAAPFIATPTLGQAIWTTGYSQSFANESIFSIYARNFGFPQPAAMPFGLMGGYPAGLFIAAGLHPADAYSLMAALWLCLGLWSAWRIGSMLGVGEPLAALGAVWWISMPVVWAHAGYSMVSLGIALLPFYFWAALKLFTESPVLGSSRILNGALYVTACVVAFFMDGYSLMMFAVGASILGMYLFLRFADRRRRLLLYSFPIHVVGFALAYLIYWSYIGKPQFSAEPLGHFRAFGVDVAFMAVPTRGMHWVWDAMGFSAYRPGERYFGDASVWMTTFSAPVITFGLIGWWRARRRSPLATAFLLVALFATYMALGPSLKIESVKPPAAALAGVMPGAMPAEYAVAPTGSAWLSEKLPGFKAMRAPYRWTALGVFAFWILSLMLLMPVRGRHAVWGSALLILLIASNMPRLDAKWNENRNYRRMFAGLDKEFVEDLRQVLRTEERVAFLPFRNDFMVNYAASRIGVRAYNIGGDKGLREAVRHWPPLMREFRFGTTDSGFAKRVQRLLSSRTADAVVLPYIDMLLAAHKWPAKPEFKPDVAPTIAALKSSGAIDIEERRYYAIARPKAIARPAPFQ